MQLLWCAVLRWGVSSPGVGASLLLSTRLATLHQAKSGREDGRSSRDNVRLCFRSLDVLFIGGLIALLLYFVKQDYGVDFSSVLYDLFPRELAVLRRLVYGME